MQSLGTVEILLTINAGLLALAVWGGKTWFRSHMRQHEQMAIDNKELTQAINNLTAVCASKDSVDRVYTRLDDHSVRLARVETRLDNGGVK